MRSWIYCVCEVNSYYRDRQERTTSFPTLRASDLPPARARERTALVGESGQGEAGAGRQRGKALRRRLRFVRGVALADLVFAAAHEARARDRKSTRLNSSH